MPRILTAKEKRETEQRLQWETDKWYDLACREFGLPEIKLKVTFRLRGNTAGKAHSNYIKSEYEIKYNLILAFENQENFYKRTVPHEVMHIIATRLYKGRQGHNQKWKNLMLKFGLDATRCHTYDVSNLKRNKKTKRVHKKFTYACVCGQTFEVGKNIHNKIQSGQKTYSHIKCRYPKSPLFYKG